MSTAVRARPGAGITARRQGWRLPTTLAGLLGVLTLFITGCGAGPHAAPQPAAASYGALPSWLPTTDAQADSVLTGTVDRPALTTEGDSVKVQLAQGSVLITVTGPQVPGEGLPYQTPATTCTWTITMTGASSELPITVADFTSLDHLGGVYHPTLVAGQPVPPRTIGRGQTVSFELRTVMTVGEGLMRWAPGGQKIVASWDFEVEND